MTLTARTSLILVLISLVTSRLLFALIDDSEGPNLLIVVVGACIVYAVLRIIIAIISAILIKK